MNFASPWWLLGLLTLPLLAWLRGRSGRESAFIYSSLTLVKGITELSRSRAASCGHRQRGDEAGGDA